ncbi:MAG: hypothetical protein CMJ48_03910, partial [Planctomycetaceae bacterium]|nr:hypothetical protein [Planctomycetaceae bacterium]
SDGRIGLGAHNAIAVFDDFQARALAATLPYFDDFEDGEADFFGAATGRWMVNRWGRYRADPESAGSDSIALLDLSGPLPADLQIGVTLKGKTGPSGYLTNALVIFDYHGPDDFKFAGGFFGANQWRLGHFDGSNWITDISLAEPIAVDVDYDVEVVLTGTRAWLKVNGAEKLNFNFAADALNDGRIGLGTRRAIAVFDNLAVEASPVPLTGAAAESVAASIASAAADRALVAPSEWIAAFNLLESFEEGPLKTLFAELLEDAPLRP